MYGSPCQGAHGWPLMLWVTAWRCPVRAYERPVINSAFPGVLGTGERRGSVSHIWSPSKSLRWRFIWRTRSVRVVRSAFLTFFTFAFWDRLFTACLGSRLGIWSPRGWRSHRRDCLRPLSSSASAACGRRLQSQLCGLRSSLRARLCCQALQRNGDGVGWTACLAIC